jgi:hypothetical protein
MALVTASEVRTLASDSGPVARRACQSSSIWLRLSDSRVM